MRFSTLSTLAAITNIIYAAPAAISSDATTPPSSLPSITGSLLPTGFIGSAGMPKPSANCTNGTDGAPAPTDFNVAAAKTGLPTIPITIINNTVANVALQGTGTGLPTIPISIVNNTVANEPTGLPSKALSTSTESGADFMTMASGIPSETAPAVPLAKRNNVAFPYCQGGATEAAAASIPVNTNDENDENSQAELL